MTTMQMPLIEVNYEREPLKLPLLSLLPDFRILGPAPTAAFVADVRDNGQRHLIDITENDDSWHVLDGGRRIKALRALGHVDVEAMWIKGLRDPDSRAAWTVAVNNLRSTNPVMEARQVAELAARGYSEKEICSTLRLTKAEVKRLGTLLALPPTILEGVSTGKVALGTAYSVAKMPQSRRDRLAEVLAKNGKLTGQDVQAARQVQVGEAHAALALPGLEYEPEPEMFVYCYDGLFTTTTPLGAGELENYKQGLKRPFEKFRLVKA